MKSIVSLMIMLCCSVMHAQDIQSSWRLGLRGGFQQSMFDGTFKELPGLENCCTGFSGISSQIDPFAGLGIHYDIGSGFGFDVEFNAIRARAQYSVENTIGNALQFNGSGFDIVQAQSLHTIQFSIPSVEVAPMISINPFGGLGIFAGMRVNKQFNSSAESSEELLSPKGVVFADTKSTIRNKQSTTFLPESIIYGPTFGFRYTFMLSSTLSLTPDFSYTLYLNHPIPFSTNNATMSLSAIRAGIELGYTGITKEEQYIAPEIISIPPTPLPLIVEDTIKPYVPLRLKASMATQKGDGNQDLLDKIVIEEINSLTMTPLLPYVFFEDNLAEIPKRYKRLNSDEAKTFSIDSLYSPNHVQTYHHILNIIGKRLIDKPNASIILTGCNADIDQEKNNRILSQQRAEALRKYLIETWNISEKRINIQTRDLPEKHANSQSEMGKQENRRVEITSNDPYIISPIIIKNIFRNINPSVLRFKPSIEDSAIISEWEMVVSQKGKELKRFNAKSTVPGVIDWLLDEEMVNQIFSDSTLTFHFQAKTSKQDSAEVIGDLPISKITLNKSAINRLQEKEHNTFTLLLFDVRSSEISKENQTIIDIIKGFIKPHSKIEITGFTDQLGNELKNQELAETRAMSTAKALSVEKRSTIIGKGNSALYDAQYPECRLYTRTVNIVVDTQAP